VVHIFSERAREYYDLERLWRTAERIDFPAPAAGQPIQSGQPSQSSEASESNEAST
jgi:hypothetical protein